MGWGWPGRGQSGTQSQQQRQAVLTRGTEVPKEPWAWQKGHHDMPQGRLHPSSAWDPQEDGEPGLLGVGSLLSRSRLSPGKAPTLLVPSGKFFRLHLFHQPHEDKITFLPVGVGEG